MAQTPEERRISKRDALRRFYARGRGEDVPLMSGKIDNPKYGGQHMRVCRERGKASRCVFGEHPSKRYEWANLTGDYLDVDDFAEMCISCHHRFDYAVASMLRDGPFRKPRKPKVYDREERHARYLLYGC